MQRHSIAPISASVLGIVLGGFCLVGCVAPPTPQAAPSVPAAPADVEPSRYLVKLWEHPGTFEEAKIVSLQGNALYVAGTPRGLVAIDAQTGRPLWRHIGERNVDAAPTQLGHGLYILEGGRFVTLDKRTGRELRRVKSRVGSSTPVYPSEITWLVGSSNDSACGIIPNSGRKAWQVVLSAGIVASTWDGDDLAYFLTADGVVHAVSIATQSKAWPIRMPRRLCSPPVYANGTLYIGCSDYYLYVMDGGSGAFKWRICLSAPVMDAPVVAGGRVYALTTDGVLHAIDLKSRQEVWSLADGGAVLTTTPKHVIFLRRSEMGDSIGVADAETGKLLAEAAAERRKFFVAAPESGIFYAVSGNGAVAAIAEREVGKKWLDARLAAE